MRVSKSTKILMVRSLNYLENGPFTNMGITSWFYLPYFIPTIDFNMLRYIISSESLVSEDLLAGLLLDCNDFIIPDGSKHTMHAII